MIGENTSMFNCCWRSEVWLFNYCSATTSSIPTGIFRFFIIACQGTIYVSEHNHVWAQSCLGTIMSGHNRVWAQSCLGTNVSGHKRVWAQMCLGTNVHGHKCLWAQTYMFLPRHDCDHTIIACQGTNVSGHKHVWAQTCVGTNMSGHKRVRPQTCVCSSILIQSSQQDDLTTTMNISTMRKFVFRENVLVYEQTKLAFLKRVHYNKFD